jgi:hypothetical protein
MSSAIFADGLGYEGKVTLTLKSGGRVLKSRTYKNNGTAQLFRFLGYCLIGACEDSEAKKLLPTKILLLANDSGDPATADPTSVTQQSDWQTYAQTPTISSTPSHVSVTYNFEIPRNAIFGSFNQVALYGVGINHLADFSAYYFLTDALGAFEEQKALEWSATTVLLIDWELTLSNKNVES